MLPAKLDTTVIPKPENNAVHAALPPSLIKWDKLFASPARSDVSRINKACRTARTVTPATIPIPSAKQNVSLVSLARSLTTLVLLSVWHVQPVAARVRMVRVYAMTAMSVNLCVMRIRLSVHCVIRASSSMPQALLFARIVMLVSINRSQDKMSAILVQLADSLKPQACLLVPFAMRDLTLTLKAAHPAPTVLEDNIKINPWRQPASTVLMAFSLRLLVKPNVLVAKQDASAMLTALPRARSVLMVPHSLRMARVLVWIATLASMLVCRAKICAICAARVVSVMELAFQLV